MSKQRSSKNKKRKSSRDKTSCDEKLSEKSESVMPSAHSIRETIESIVVAFVLAFLFRTFEAEAFVIPTGSMAHTLQGAHKDVECPQCGIGYQVSASSEFPTDGSLPKIVTAGTCPNCGFTMPMLESATNEGQSTFSGDRILVNKFAYELNDPKRWDVVVFKYPGGAATNYIKRLIGLPNETVRIWKGDIHIRKGDEQSFQIARKPPAKMITMLQLVNDSRHVPQQMIAAGWPARWQNWPMSNPAGTDGWTSDDGGRTFSFAGGSGTIRYRHVLPAWNEWQSLNAQPPQLDSEMAGYLRDEQDSKSWEIGSLVTDFYSYNTHTDWAYSPHADRVETHLGLHWVGDLSVTCNVEVTSSDGMITLDLVEAGRRHRCAIDVSDGTATLSIKNLNPDGELVQFDAAEGISPADPTKVTPLRGPGSYELRFANVDDQLTLWVDGDVIEFDTPTTYRSPVSERPYWSPTEPGDLAPIGVGGDGVTMNVKRLRVWRDLYYVANKENRQQMADYESPHGHSLEMSSSRLSTLFQEGESWADSTIWDMRRSIHFKLKDDQFFPLGDNSPASKDGRLWNPKHQYFERDLLIGKAVFIYWPHGWNIWFPHYKPPFVKKQPFWPNWRKMQFVR
jgi:signal peptidase I